jgi:hypothetical protein
MGRVYDGNGHYLYLGLIRWPYDKLRGEKRTFMREVGQRRRRRERKKRFQDGEMLASLRRMRHSQLEASSTLTQLDPTGHACLAFDQLLWGSGPASSLALPPLPFDQRFSGLHR